MAISVFVEHLCTCIYQHGGNGHGYSEAEKGEAGVSEASSVMRVRGGSRFLTATAWTGVTHGPLGQRRRAVVSRGSLFWLIIGIGFHTSLLQVGNIKGFLRFYFNTLEIRSQLQSNNINYNILLAN